MIVYINMNLLPLCHILTNMKSTRKGLRAGDLEKDTYGRLRCSSCEMDLDTENDPDVVGKVRACPECGAQWKEVG